MTGQALLILAGVIGTVTLLSIVLNLVESWAGPWGRLSAQFPAQPADPAARTGTASVAITRRPMTIAPRLGRSGRRRWTIAAVLGLLGLLLILGAFTTYFVTLLLFPAILLPALFLVIPSYSPGHGWSFFGGPHRSQVDWASDDDHLHLRVQGDVTGSAPAVSVPWAAIEQIEFDTATNEFVVLPIGDRFAHLPTEVVAYELEVRNAAQLQVAPAPFGEPIS